MNTENLITLLRGEIEKIGNKCYSPDLPQNDEVCCSLSLESGVNQRALNTNILYSSIPGHILIRGTFKDKETRRMADKIFNQIDMKENVVFKNTRVILISCKTPNYAFRDESQRIYYNINFDVQIEWRNN